MPPAPGADGFGLQVFDATGKCTFDSSFQYARVIDVKSEVGAGAFPSGSVTYPAGRVYATAWLQQAWRAYTTDRIVGASHYWTQHWQTGTTSWAGAVVTYGDHTQDGEEQLPVSTGPGPQKASGGYVIAVLDVTGQ